MFGAVSLNFAHLLAVISWGGVTALWGLRWLQLKWEKVKVPTRWIGVVFFISFVATVINIMHLTDGLHIRTSKAVGWISAFSGIVLLLTSLFPLLNKVKGR